MLAYQKDSVRQIEVVMKDIDVADDDILVQVQLDIPTTMDTWVEANPAQGDYSLNISLWRSVTPVFTEAEQNAMNTELTELLFDLNDGSVACTSSISATRSEKSGC